jgi:hypothetical protein
MGDVFWAVGRVRKREDARATASRIACDAPLDPTAEI